MPSQPAERTAEGLAQLDKLLEHRSRLGACVLLAGTQALAFARLRELLRETDGNMGAQLRKLEDAGYVKVDKRFEKRRPVSWYKLTAKGEAALKGHMAALQTVIGGASA
ncbi:MAG: transcriptional regulator [Candidatus Latescibacteria bacterium]|nr:transcriptional regulator [Candidatus Latescibacterota bacterium]